MSDDVLIRVENLHRYYGELCAVRALNFELRKGEVLGLLGPNGAGKTTAMQIISGNLAPSVGRVWIGGIDLLDDPRGAKTQLGYLPEQPPLYREFTVDEYLGFCARIHGIPRAGVRDAVAHARARCGLREVGGRLIGNLSKGYRQRIGIAQAIIHTPAVVILDEPTVGLDPIQILEIRDLIRSLGEAHGVIVSTHTLPEVQAVCNRVLMIDRGERVLYGSLEEITRDGGDHGLTAAFRHPPQAAEVATLPGVARVEALPDGRLRVQPKPGADPVEALVARAVEGGWGLYELIPERTSLERLFVDLVYRDARPGTKPPSPAPVPTEAA
ncbi:putative ABC transporter ATP-binding protein YxlF [bacterium BMS3Bbin12]|nr:putative ABC transporter ATP-binding protein YxlF [bacterium BMS3Abin12]GBE46917.1 putative ABC transporter ATP-binding protein YxlF [bacterium BMS3Bbin12]GBE50614.1 putative ABC transporter ATP-binding protein YxlF [bacterium BMS3Bbin13]HDK02855.1 ATP-binding cassette domain-containing protein [Gammaproteobacteria bacterium]HDO33904.1 ATP-binding cassette domain-containing protein [Chromatiales bacterium]